MPRLLANFLIASTLVYATDTAAQSQASDWPLYDPRILPTPAIAGQNLQFVLTGSGCHGGTEPTISRQGDTVVARHFVWDVCGPTPPGGPFWFTQDIGKFEPGKYKLIWQPYNDFVPVGTYTATINFTVGIGAPAPVPTSSRSTSGLLAVGVTLLGALGIRRRQWRLLARTRHAVNPPRAS